MPRTAFPNPTTWHPLSESILNVFPSMLKTTLFSSSWIRRRWTNCRMSDVGWTARTASRLICRRQSEVIFGLQHSLKAIFRHNSSTNRFLRNMSEQRTSSNILLCLTWIGLHLYSRGFKYIPTLAMSTIVGLRHPFISCTSECSLTLWVVSA